MKFAVITLYFAVALFLIGAVNTVAASDEASCVQTPASIDAFIAPIPKLFQALDQYHCPAPKDFGAALQASSIAIDEDFNAYAKMVLAGDTYGDEAQLSSMLEMGIQHFDAFPMACSHVDAYKKFLATHTDFSLCSCPATPKEDYAGVICEKNKPPSIHLSLTEAVVLGMYVGDAYKKLNTTLRQGDKTAVCDLMPLIFSMEKALTRFPAFHDTLYRGTGELPPEVMAQHKVGNVVEYAAFTSTTVDMAVANRFGDPQYGGWIFTIHPKKSCFDIRKFNYAEEEITCLPGTHFHIDSRDDAKHNITMTEVD